MASSGRNFLKPKSWCIGTLRRRAQVMPTRTRHVRPTSSSDVSYHRRRSSGCIFSCRMCCAPWSLPSKGMGTILDNQSDSFWMTESSGVSTLGRHFWSIITWQPRVLARNGFLTGNEPPRPDRGGDATCFFFARQVTTHGLGALPRAATFAGRICAAGLARRPTPKDLRVSQMLEIGGAPLKIVFSRWLSSPQASTISPKRAGSHGKSPVCRARSHSSGPHSAAWFRSLGTGVEAFADLQGF